VKSAFDDVLVQPQDSSGVFSIVGGDFLLFFGYVELGHYIFVIFLIRSLALTFLCRIGLQLLSTPSEVCWTQVFSSGRPSLMRVCNGISLGAIVGFQFKDHLEKVVEDMSNIH
jgi:hypothetical protein